MWAVYILADIGAVVVIGAVVLTIGLMRMDR